MSRMEVQRVKRETERKNKRELHFDGGQLRAESGEGGTRSIRGYPVLFEMIGSPYMGSDWKEIIDKQALRDLDLSKTAFLLDHQTWAVLGVNGKNMKAEIDDIGLFIDCTLGNSWLDDYVFDRVQRGLVDSMSFWFFCDEWDTDTTNKIDRVKHITKLPEVSLVLFPAYRESVAITSEGSDGTRGQKDSGSDEADARKRAELSLEISLL